MNGFVIAWYSTHPTWIWLTMNTIRLCICWVYLMWWRNWSNGWYHSRPRYNWILRKFSKYHLNHHRNNTNAFLIVWFSDASFDCRNSALEWNISVFSNFNQPLSMSIRKRRFVERRRKKPFKRVILRYGAIQEHIQVEREREQESRRKNRLIFKHFSTVELCFTSYLWLDSSILSRGQTVIHKCTLFMVQYEFTKYRNKNCSCSTAQIALLKWSLVFVVENGNECRRTNGDVDWGNYQNIFSLGIEIARERK